MANSAGMFWLPDFDPSAIYVVSAWPAGMTVAGVEPKRGELFDKSKVTERQLKRMYADRWIATVDNYEPRPKDDAEQIKEAEPVRAKQDRRGARAHRS